MIFSINFNKSVLLPLYTDSVALPTLPTTAAAVNQYLLPAGPTAVSLQQWVCCCFPALGQTDGHCTIS